LEIDVSFPIELGIFPEGLRIQVQKLLPTDLPRRMPYQDDDLFVFAFIGNISLGFF
jgi:hypothetical protein